MKWGVKITFGMLVVSVLFSTAVLGRNLWMQEKEQMKFEDLRERIYSEKGKSNLKVHANMRGHKAIEGMVVEERVVLPEFQEIAKENPDFVGWISIEGTNIDYPVMQTTWEPEYYLHRNFAGDYSYAGIPFVGTGDLKAEGGDLFIYGHNMKNGTMFADLLNYLEEQYFEEHPIICLDTLSERRKYEVFAVLDVRDEEWIREGALFYNFENDLIMNRSEYMKKLENCSLYQRELMINQQGKLLFLVTCSYRKKNGRIVVVGRNIEQAVSGQ